MKLTIKQITTITAAGFGCLRYAALNNVDALSAYRLRRDFVRIDKEFAEAKNSVLDDCWKDKELLKRSRDYEITGTGMTKEEYEAACEANMPKVLSLWAEMEKEEKDIPIKPISFDSWLLLLKDNPFLAGWEEVLADFIVQPD